MTTLATPQELLVPSLHEVFASIPDPRGKNKRHPLTALLGGLLVALCSGYNAMSHAVIFLRQHPAYRRQLGFTHPISPSQSTYTRLFSQLSPEHFFAAVRQWLLALAQQRFEAKRHGEIAVAVDGKGSRGTGEHLVYLFIQDFWLLLDLFEVGEKTNEHKRFENKVQELLARYPFISIFTFDALYAQHDLAASLTSQGKRAIFQIKGNQKETLRALKKTFASLAQSSSQVETVEKKWGLHRDAPLLGQEGREGDRGPLAGGAPGGHVAHHLGEAASRG